LFRAGQYRNSSNQKEEIEMIIGINHKQVRQILRRKQVEQMTGLSRSTIYQWIKDGSFPASITLGRRSVGWDMAEIQDWIQQRRTQSTITTSNPLRSARDAQTNSLVRVGTQVVNKEVMGGHV
jgi:prophage regulatory protein